MAGLSLLLLAMAAGCAMPAARQGIAPEVAIDSRGVVSVDDVPVRIEDLPRVLRRARVSPDRTLVVHYADDTGKRLIPELTTVLRRAGFRKVLFAGTHRASATVAD